MAQREKWLEEQRLVPAMRRECGVKIAAVLVLHVLAVTSFASGFLLSRGQVADVSPTVEGARPRYDKVVAIVVDALRSDFVCIADELGAEEARGTRRHRKALPVFRELCEGGGGGGSGCRLLEFVADAPTTTMQRLKGLTTGSLPTFVDIGSSLSARALEEDNLVRQLKLHGRRVVHMGDDTWRDLFPEDFSQSFPFPSLDVNDLNTVDDGVEALLGPLVESGQDWDVIVAHLLGVDHCGHTHDIHSREMVTKLGQVDRIVREVARGLEERATGDDGFGRALLLVFGDHGQTRSGEHGGSTREEVSTVLLAYDIDRRRAEGNVGGTDEVDGACPAAMSQLDFAATVSEMLGLPIPFSNVGQVNYDLWSLGADPYGERPASEVSSEFEEALQRNAAQVDAYLESSLLSQNASGILSWRRSQEAFSGHWEVHRASVAEHVGGSAEAVRNRTHARRAYLDAVASHARSIWTKFNFWLMALGILFAVAAALIQLNEIRAGFFCYYRNNHKLCLASLLVLNAALMGLIPDHDGDIWNRRQEGGYQVGHILTDASFALAAYLGLLQLRKKRRSPPASGGFVSRLPGLNLKELAFLYTCCLALVFSFLKNTGQEDPSQVWHPGRIARQVHILTATQLGWAILAGLSGRLGGGKGKGSSRLSLAVRSTFCLLPELYMIQFGNGRLALSLAYIQVFVSIILYVKIQFCHQRVDLELLGLLLFGLYAPQVFHATGHRCQFSALQYNSAFVGFESFSWWRGAALLTLNTYASHVLSVLLVVCLYSKQHVKKQGTALLAFGFAFSLRTIAVMACASLHARHLMVWGVFAQSSSSTRSGCAS
ncbi:GPI ethanolamine phosphate transferase [Chloropicon roscoffensis]|uniref:GPI ethanolamine phosphate transferase n=1 Tax=Chloropicon roscoffensis TaxID=1461544 RepID=A0AAX4NZK3_9CHLO